MTDRDPLQRFDPSGRKHQTATVASLRAGPGRQRLASCNDRTHDRRLESVNGESRINPSKWSIAMPGINQTERTVLKYVKLEFRGEWEYHGDEFSFCPVKKAEELLVVVEAPVGSLETIWFLVQRRPDPPGGFLTTDAVLVPKEQNIVYIPERCVRREKGDHTECAS
jgi:hypothetical protein